MKNNSKKKFSWCPVCMIHTYQYKKKMEWACLNPDHQALLRHRTDPWIKEYRQARINQRVAIESEA